MNNLITKKQKLVILITSILTPILFLLVQHYFSTFTDEKSVIIRKIVQNTSALSQEKQIEHAEFFLQETTPVVIKSNFHTETDLEPYELSKLYYLLSLKLANMKLKNIKGSLNCDSMFVKYYIVFSGKYVQYVESNQNLREDWNHIYENNKDTIHTLSKCLTEAM